MAKRFEDIMQRQLSRRRILKGFAVGAAATLGARRAGAEIGPRGHESCSVGFSELPGSFDDRHHLTHGYRSEVLLRWGDPILKGAPKFDATALSPKAQAQQFGYNNDFTQYVPLARGAEGSKHGLLCVNHEYTDPQLMWPGLTRRNAASKLTPAQMEVELQAHGHSVVEIRQKDGRWSVIQDSAYNRRLTVKTPMRISGPAAGHDRMKTQADPSGRKVMGTFGNCGGGMTPWGTILIAEENVDVYFQGNHASEARNHKRMGTDRPSYMCWHRFDDRFCADRVPTEPNRFGWVVEFDPKDPKSVPTKRTALGRFKHESATVVLNHDNRVVVFSGDDERFEHLYRYVSKHPYDPAKPERNKTLLDEGTLYAARFEDDGSVRWLPLIYGRGPLTKKNGFSSQAEVLIEARHAARLMGATEMDRPEDVDAHPLNGKVYVALSNNTKRKSANAANPRCQNQHGHIVELTHAPRGKGHDYAAQEHSWGMFLLGGDPRAQENRSYCHPGISEDGWLSCPDNFVFDPQGRLWICTDGQESCGKADSLYAADTEGEGRGLTKRFFNGPRGAEITGPSFTPDGNTLFLAIQHPAQEKGSTYDTPTTRWPDFDPKMPPRPSIVVITKKDDGEFGA